jgi:hypothetical protein
MAIGLAGGAAPKLGGEHPGAERTSVGYVETSDYADFVGAKTGEIAFRAVLSDLESRGSLKVAGTGGVGGEGRVMSVPEVHGGQHRGPGTP